MVCGVSRVLSYDYVKRRFMPRKPLDMRKACGRLFAYGKQKAPWGVWSWLFALIPYAAEALVKRSVE